jgi:hypothetical protein
MLVVDADSMTLDEALALLARVWNEIEHSESTHGLPAELILRAYGGWVEAGAIKLH